MFDTCPPKNEHWLDRALRIVLGAGLLALTFVGPKTQWGALGLIPLATGLSGRCPLYMLLGWSTRGLGGRRLAPPTVRTPSDEA